MKDTWKGIVNAKWVSTEQSRKHWDAIFGKRYIIQGFDGEGRVRYTHDRRYTYEDGQKAVAELTELNAQFTAVDKSDEPLAFRLIPVD